jgi:hypothetical protein
MRRKYFAPGSNSSNCSLLIKNYMIGIANSDNPSFKSCIINEIIDKPNTNSNISTNQRAAQIINSAIGGNTYFGSYYLGEPVVFNFLGRVEGQIGGSGAPLRNRF